jgi:hypothetical protein
MAAMNKFLARNNKTRRAGKPTQEREISQSSLGRQKAPALRGFEKGPNHAK